MSSSDFWTAPGICRRWSRTNELSCLCALWGMPRCGVRVGTAPRKAGSSCVVLTRRSHQILICARLGLSRSKRIDRVVQRSILLVCAVACHCPINSKRGVLGNFSNTCRKSVMGEAGLPRGTLGGPWFRGQQDDAWPLKPKLYRGRLPSKTDLRESEDEIREEFIKRAPIFFEASPAADEMRAEWEWYFMMQHHQAATRLLDWTVPHADPAWSDDESRRPFQPDGPAV